MAKNIKKSSPEVQPAFACMLTELQLIEYSKSYFSARELVGRPEPWY